MPLDVIRQRLSRQFLTGPKAQTAVEVIRALGAVQAQDYAGAKWALGMRVRSTTDAAIEDAIGRGQIIRTHILRPTWHFVLPEDIRWMLALTGPRIAAAMASYNRKMELTPAILRRTHAVLEKALRDGQHLTRQELATHLRKARVGEVAAQRLGHMMMHAELDAVVCSGARRGKQFTYAHFDERVPATASVDRDDSLGRLARRYFSTRGPASLHDFSWWSGLSVTDSRRAIEVLGHELTRVEVGDRAMWLVERNAPVPAAEGTAHLLPNYDEYFIGYKDRSSIGRRWKGTDLVTGGNFLINHIVVVGGEIVGGWKRLQKGDTTVVAAKIPVRITREERALLEKVRAGFEAFLQGPVSLA